MVSFDLFFNMVSFKYLFYEVVAFASMRRYWFGVMVCFVAWSVVTPWIK
jgi:hypothetical protein